MRIMSARTISWPTPGDGRLYSCSLASVLPIRVRKPSVFNLFDLGLSGGRYAAQPLVGFRQATDSGWTVEVDAERRASTGEALPNSRARADFTGAGGVDSYHLSPSRLSVTWPAENKRATDHERGKCLESIGCATKVALGRSTLQPLRPTRSGTHGTLRTQGRGAQGCRTTQSVSLCSITRHPRRCTASSEPEHFRGHSPPLGRRACQ